MSSLPDVTTSSVILCLNCRKPGTTKKVDEDRVKVLEERNDREIDKNRLRISKKLYESPEVDAIAQHMKAATRYVENQSQPVETIKAGMHQIAAVNLLTVVRRLEQYARDLEPLIADFKAAWPRLIERAYEELGSLVEPKDFPAWDEVEKKISITWHVLTFSTPSQILGQINMDLCREEERKIAQHIDYAAEQLETAIAIGFQGVIDHLSERLQPGKDGRPRKISDSAVEKFNRLLASLLANNTTGNEKLASIGQQVEAIMNGATPEELSTNRNVRTTVLASLQRIGQEMGELTVTRTGRKIVVPRPEPEIQQAAA